MSTCSRMYVWWLITVSIQIYEAYWSIEITQQWFEQRAGNTIKLSDIIYVCIRYLEFVEHRSAGKLEPFLDLPFCLCMRKPYRLPSKDEANCPHCTPLNIMLHENNYMGIKVRFGICHYNYNCNKQFSAPSTSRKTTHYNVNVKETELHAWRMFSNTSSLPT